MSELPKYSSIVIKIPAKMLYGQHLKPSLTRKLKNVAHTDKKPAITLKADTKIKKAEIENKGEMTKRKVVKPKVVNKVVKPKVVKKKVVEEKRTKLTRGSKKLETERGEIYYDKKILREAIKMTLNPKGIKIPNLDTMKFDQMIKKLENKGSLNKYRKEILNKARMIYAILR